MYHLPDTTWTHALSPSTRRQHLQGKHEISTCCPRIKITKKMAAGPQTTQGTHFRNFDSIQLECTNEAPVRSPSTRRKHQRQTRNIHLLPTHKDYKKNGWCPPNNTNLENNVDAMQLEYTYEAPVQSRTAKKTLFHRKKTEEKHKIKEDKIHVFNSMKYEPIEVYLIGAFTALQLPLTSYRQPLANRGQHALNSLLRHSQPNRQKR